MKIFRSFLKFNKLSYRYDSLSNLYARFHVFSRTTLILPNMVGLDLFVHNGKFLFTVDIKPVMIGHKLGEFCFTKLTGRGTRRKRKISLRKKDRKERFSKSKSKSKSKF